MTVVYSQALAVGGVTASSFRVPGVSLIDLWNNLKLFTMVEYGKVRVKPPVLCGMAKSTSAEILLSRIKG